MNIKTIITKMRDAVKTDLERAGKYSDGVPFLTGKRMRVLIEILLNAANDRGYNEIEDFRNDKPGEFDKMLENLTQISTKWLIEGLNKRKKEDENLEYGNALSPDEFGKRLGRLSIPLLMVDYIDQEDLWNVERALMNLINECTADGSAEMKVIANAFLKALPNRMK